jgi:hypothetical protein
MEGEKLGGERCTTQAYRSFEIAYLTPRHVEQAQGCREHSTRR